MSRNIYDLDTPALLVDLDRLEANIERMATVARQGGKSLRPHIKTHKTPEIARMQRAAGAQGLTVAKLGEAEVMADAGFEDIFMANQVVGPIKVERLLALLRRCRLTVGIDSIEAARPLSEAAVRMGISLPVRIEVDTGIQRAGVRTVEAAAALGSQLKVLQGLQVVGLFTYEGHANNGGEADRKVACQDAAEKLRQIAASLQKQDIAVDVLSVGSTVGAPLMAQEPGITELRAGVYVFNDRGQVARGAREEDCALTVLSTVTSLPEPDMAILDAGTKTLSGDRGREGSVHGTLLEDPEIVFDWANEEHGHLDLRNASLRPTVGQKLRIIPFHACTATNMHETLYAIRGESVEATWKIAARGKIQ